MNNSYETHACVICGGTKFVSAAGSVYRKTIYGDQPIKEYMGTGGENLEACTVCGTVRDMNIVNERFKEKHHESTDKR